MGRLGPWGFAAVASVLAVACTTSPRAPEPSDGAPGWTPELPPLPELSERVWIEGPLPPRPGAPAPTTLLRRSGAPRWIESPTPTLRVSALDLDNWPFGWVEDPEGLRLGRPTRFWSDSKPLWNRIFATSGAQVVPLLEAAHRASLSDEERLRSSWRLWLAYGQAGLGVEARLWLDRAREAAPDSALVRLETAWDQRFRVQDPEGARAWWGQEAPLPADPEVNKARLLRQNLFGGSQDFASVGADSFVSTLVLDRDDLWVGTWNGAVVRRSLVTGETIRLWQSDQVSPITRMVTTRWFVYAFQDRSLLRYSKVTGVWRTFDYPEGWTGLRIGGAVASGEEALTVGYLGGGLWRWDRGEWSLVDDGGGGPFVTSLGEWGDLLLVGTKDRGLWTFGGGRWAPVPSVGPGPSNISVLEASPEGTWAVGTWGEGAWLYDGEVLSPVSGGREYISAAAWAQGPLWGVVDEGLVRWNPRREVLGPLDGVDTDVSGLVVWEGRWLWGTGQGLSWWTEYENPALPR